MLNKDFDKLYRDYVKYTKVNDSIPPYTESYRDLHIYSLLVIIEGLSNDYVNRYRSSQITIDKDDLISVGLTCAIRYVDKYIMNEREGLNTASLSSFAYRQIQHEINKYCTRMLTVLSFQTDKGYMEYNNFDVRSDDDNPILENIGYLPDLEMLGSVSGESLFGHLKDWERDIVFKHFGIGISSEPKNFNEISEDTGFSPREIGYIVKRSIQKLKSVAKQSGLSIENFNAFLMN